MREWVAKRGWQRLIQTAVLLVLMVAVHGCCFIRTHIPWEWLGIGEVTSMEFSFPGAEMLTLLYFLQIPLILVRHRSTDVAALLLGAFTCLWTVFPDIPESIYFFPVGGLGTYEVAEQPLGYLVATMSLFSLLLNVHAFQTQTRVALADDGLRPLVCTHNGRLRLLAIVLTLLIVWGSYGDCIQNTTNFLPPDCGRASIISYEGFTRGAVSGYTILLWIQVLLLVANRKIWLVLAEICSGLVLWGFLSEGSYGSWTKEYEVSYSITALGWGLIVLCVLNGLLCLYLAEQSAVNTKQQIKKR